MRGLTLLAALSLAAPALAQPTSTEAATEEEDAVMDEEEDPAVTAARRSFDEGRSLADAHRYAEAAAAFQASLQLSPRPSTRFNLALTHFARGHHLAAIAELDAYLGAPELDETERADATQMLGLARRALSRLALAIEPADAAVTVNGATLEGGATREVALDAGMHVVRVDAEGHAARVLEVQTQPGETSRRAVHLTSTRIPARLEVDAAASGARILVDGAPVGIGHASVSLDAGAHRVRVLAGEDLPPVDREVVLDWSDRVSLVVEPVLPAPRALHEEPAFWGVLGGAVAIGGAALLTWALVEELPVDRGGSTGVVLFALGEAR